jgi:hypothetical protein
MKPISTKTIDRLYPGFSISFIAWAARTNANYCRTYRTLCAGHNADEWDRFANKLDITSTGSKIEYES